MAANVRKVTLAVAAEDYAWAAQTAKSEGSSVSAVFSAALQDKRRAEARDDAFSRCSRGAR